MLLSGFNDIKKLNKRLFKKFFDCDVSYDSSFLALSADEISERKYFGEEIYSDEGDSDTIKVGDFEGIRLSKNKIEFFKKGELCGLSIERLKEDKFKVTFKAGDSSFTEEISLLKICGEPRFFFGYDFERLDSNFSKVKVKNFLVKNFNLFKESVEECDKVLGLKLFK